MGNELQHILLDEIRLNRKAITGLNDKIHKLDKDIFSNKIKLSMFIGGVSLFSSIVWAILFEKIKTYIGA